MYTQKMYEVQTHATMTYHGYLGYAVISNHAFWTGLPPSIREALERAIAETTPVANAFALQENEDALAEMKASGRTTFHEPTEAERAAWRRARARSRRNGRPHRPRSHRPDLCRHGAQAPTR